MEAFTELVRLHQAKIRAYIGRFLRDDELVDDLAQETFVAAFRGLSKFGHDAPFRLGLNENAVRVAIFRIRRFLRACVRGSPGEVSSFTLLDADTQTHVQTSIPRRYRAFASRLYLHTSRGMWSRTGRHICFLGSRHTAYPSHGYRCKEVSSYARSRVVRRVAKTAQVWRMRST